MTLPVLEGKAAIITGASIGIGKAIAELFAEAKAKIVVADLNEEKGQETVDGIKAAGGEASFVKVDISKAEEIKAMVQFTIDTYGRLDVGVNNAVLMPDDRPADDFDEDCWDRIMAVNLKSIALCQKYELKQMKKQGEGGSIINISSVSDFHTEADNIAYAAVKHAIVGITKIAASENGQYNIRVNAVVPGANETLMPRDAHEQTREIAEATLWLASDASSYVTGTTIHADAGYTSS